MSAVTLACGSGCVQLPALPLLHGGTLEDAQLGFELHGPDDAPVVLVLGGISAGRHVAATPDDPSPGWWDDLVGPGKALDARALRVLGIDWLGGSGTSTGPGNGGPRPFPLLTSADQAAALVHLLDELAIERASVVGSSYGGMVGLALAARVPSRVQALVAISAPDKSHPRATAWRSVQRRLVALGEAHGLGRQALELARALAMTTYRTAEELGARFDAPAAIDGLDARFPVERYLEARGRAWAAQVDPQAFLALSRAIDLHRVEPAAVAVPVTVVGVPGDELVPWQQLEALARALPDARLVELRSRYGHDAFLKEPVAVAAIVRQALTDAGRRQR